MNKKRTGIRFLLLFCAFFLMWQSPISVKAVDATTEADNLQMLGGQIRTVDPMGLRMVASIKKSYLEKLEKQGTVEYGIILLPEKYLDGRELTADGRYSYNGKIYKPAVVPAKKIFSEDDDKIYFTAVLANMAKEKYQDNYAARPYVKITTETEQEDGTVTKTEELVHGEESIKRQVYQIAKDAVDGSIETEEVKEWLRENIINPVETPEGPTEEDKDITFELGKVNALTLYEKTQEGSVQEVTHFNKDSFQKENYLVKVEMQGQPELFAEIEDLIEKDGTMNFKLKLEDYVTGTGTSKQEGAIVEFGKVEGSDVTTSYITMQALIEQIKENPSGTYVLEHDMDASQIQATEELISNFTGTFDGQGHKITGLSASLFGVVSGGTVKNLIIENANINKTQPQSNGRHEVGILADCVENNGVIENVHVIGKLYSTRTRTGGLVGWLNSATIRQCSANVDMEGYGDCNGGLVGETSKDYSTQPRIEDSYAVGTIVGRTQALGGLLGWQNDASVERCYAAVEIKSSNTSKKPGGFTGLIRNWKGQPGNVQNNVSYSTGENGYKFDGMSEANKLTSGYKNNYTLKESNLTKDSDRLGNATQGKITEKTLDELLQPSFYESMGWSSSVWDFTPLKEGKTPVLKNLDPNMTTMLEMQEIDSVEDLKAMKDNPNGRYVLQTDLDVSSVKMGDAIVTGTFKGTFRGNGHKITGQKVPIFQNLSGAVVKNLILQGGSISQTEKENVAALAKKSEKGTTVSNVYVRTMEVLGKNSVAGLIGEVDNTEISNCSANVTVTGTDSGGFAAKILNGSTVTNSYSRTILGSETGSQGGFVAVVKNSTLSRNYSELQVKEKAAKAAGIFIGKSGTEGEKPVQIENNIGFGPEGYQFNGENTESSDFDTYQGNYEYTDTSLDSKQTQELAGKIDKANAEQIISKEFYTSVLKWDTSVWHLDDVEGGKRPRLEAEGDVYDYDESDKDESETTTLSRLVLETTEEENQKANEMEIVQSQATAEMEEAATEAEQAAENETKPEETIAAVAARNLEERAVKDSLADVPGYQEERKQIYENLQILMPFYNPEQIIKDGNQVKSSHTLNHQQILAVYPMDERGNRVVSLTEDGAAKIRKIRIQFADADITPVIYNVSYINTRSNIATYTVSQLPIHYNFNKYVVNTETPQFQKLLSAGKGYDFDNDIETRVAQRDSDSVISVYRRNFTDTVKAEMEQVLISLAANNPQYPLNIDNSIAEAMVEDTFLTNEYLKDFLYAYNYVDRWYDFEIGGVNLRDVVMFDNSILHTNKNTRGMAMEITKNSSSGGRQGNSTPTFYANRIASYTGISSISAFVEYFMSAYAGYEDVNDWIIDNFQGVIVEARANNPKIDSRLWRILKYNTVHQNQQLILPTLSYKTSKNLYLASFPTSLVYGNLEIYSGYQNTEAWRESKRREIAVQLNHYKNIYDNFVDVAENGADSVNRSKFLIVDSSYNKNRSQDVFTEYYKPLQTLWGMNSGAVAIIFGNPNYDYIYYNSSSFIGDLTVLNHEMGHVTDMWIWMENKGKRPGRNGEDYSNGYANQASLDYNMNFMMEYSRDSDKVSNLTPDRINTPEEFQSYYKEVFDTIYTLDYLQGLAYLQLTPEQQSRITAQHHYGTMGNHQGWNNANSTWDIPSADKLESMNLETLDDLWDNQLTIRPGHRFDLSSQNNVGVNNLGAYNLDKLSFSSWYVPYVDGGTPNAQTFRRNGYELAGMYGYSNGLVQYLSGRTQTGDLAFYKKMTGDSSFTFEAYRKNKNTEIQEKIANQKLQGNPYFDEEALIAYFKQNLINYGNDINSGMSNGNNTLQNIKESRENVFRYLQRITNEFRSSVYDGDAASRNAVVISTGEELVQKIRENPNGFYVLANDISMESVSPENGVYVDRTFIGKLEGRGYKITNAAVPLFRRVVNSYVSDFTIQNTQGESKDWLAQSVSYTIRVNEIKKEKQISTLEELCKIGKNEYGKYILTEDIDASSFTGDVLIEGTFSSVLEGNGHTITGLKAPLFAKIDRGTVQNLNIKDVQIEREKEDSAAIAKRTNHAVLESISLENVRLSGTKYTAVITGYDYTGSTFSKIQIRNAQVTGSENYNGIFAGRVSGSHISDVAVLNSSVTAKKTENGGFIGAARNLTAEHVYSDADITLTGYTDSEDKMQSAGFIGSLKGSSQISYVFAAGDVICEDEGKSFYKFLGTSTALEGAVSHSFELENAKGTSNITESTGDLLIAATAEQKRDTEFYRSQMNLNEEVWNLSLAGMKGHPELIGMEKKEIYTIRTPEEFKNIAKYPNEEYRLEADIDLGGLEQTESVLTAFGGVLEGNNHTITGLKVPLFGELTGEVKDLAVREAAITTQQDTPSGIFAVSMKGAKISNAAIVNSSITAESGGAAAFVGIMENTSLADIFVYGTNVEGKSGASGGFAVRTADSSAERIASYVNITVPEGVQAAGFAAQVQGTGTYKNILVAGDMPSESWKFMGDVSSVENGYELGASSGKISADGTHVKEIGDDIYNPEFYTNTLGFGSELWSTEDAQKNGYPKLKGFTLSTEPWTITLNTAADMSRLNKLPSGLFILGNDLDFADNTENLVTETFKGTFLGDGHSITGLTKPLFQELSGKVENLHFRNILVENSEAGANVLAVNTNGAEVKQVFFNGITLQGQGHTGIIGTDNGSTFSHIGIQNVQMTAEQEYAGIFLAQGSHTTIDNLVLANADVTTESSYVGGFAGKLEHASVNTVFSKVALHLPYLRDIRYTAAFIGGVGENGNTVRNVVSAGGVYPEDVRVSKYKTVYITNTSQNYELSGFEDNYVNIDTPGESTLIDGLSAVREAELKTAEFYKNQMSLNEADWNLEGIEIRGFPKLKNMDADKLKPPAQEEPSAEEEPLESQVPDGFTAIRTAEDFMAISQNPSGNYILMNSISLYGYEPKDGSSFLGTFTGTLKGNRQTISDINGAPLFETFGGNVSDLKIRDVKVERFQKEERANAFARQLQDAKVTRVAFYDIQLAGGNLTGTLAGTTSNSAIEEIWAENVDINAYGPSFYSDGGDIYAVGGLIGQLNANNSIRNSYISGTMVANGNMQGGVIGQNSADNYDNRNKVEMVISNMRMKSTAELYGSSRGGFIGYLNRSYDPWVTNCISIGDANAEESIGSLQPTYRFTGIRYPSQISNGVQNCYESGNGESSVYENAIAEISKEQYHERDFYETTLKFSSESWNLSTVSELGHPVLNWIGGAEPVAEMMEETMEETEYPLMVTEVPESYTGIYTAEDLKKIAENPTGHYILMKNISLEGVSAGSSYLGNLEYPGELHGNNQVIYGLKDAPLFDSVHAKVHDLRVQDVQITKPEEQVNVLARTANLAELERLHFSNIYLSGGSYTSVVAGKANDTTINQIWIENMNINTDKESMDSTAYIGGVVASMTGTTSLKDIYIQGTMAITGNTQGSVVGFMEQDTSIERVVDNVSIKSSGTENLNAEFADQQPEENQTETETAPEAEDDTVLQQTETGEGEAADVPNPSGEKSVSEEN